MRCLYRLCQRPLPEHKGTGRPVKYCNSTCRKSEREERRRARNDVPKESFGALDAAQQYSLATGLVIVDLLRRGHQVYRPVNTTAMDLVVKVDGTLYGLYVYVRAPNYPILKENIMGWSALVDPETSAVTYFDPKNQGPARHKVGPAPEKAENALNDQQGS